MTRHQFSKAHLHAAMLALHATKSAPVDGDPPILLTAEQQATIAEATVQLAHWTGLSVVVIDDAVSSILKQRARSEMLSGIDMAEVVRLVASSVSPPRPPVARCASFPTTKRSRYRGERRPMTGYEHALVARWPTALDGGDRAQNSGEFSILASKLGATEAEIMAMVAAINTRPR